MTDKILIVTPPDDTFVQGIRITHVNLSPAQSQIVSQGLLAIQSKHNIINYVWQYGDPVSWLLNASAKSNLLIFNADNEQHKEIDQLIGYIAADPKSHYFGMLRDLHIANDRVLLNSDDVINLVEKAFQDE